MSDSTTDDATEAQMRHALGLRGDASPPSSNSGSHRQRRRFVRDGEVPVTVVHRDHSRDGEPGSSQQDAIRQAIRSQVAARESAERSLEQAQAAIRDLQTKLAHERLAKDEAVHRAEGETQSIQQTLQAVQDALATECAARQQAEQERNGAIAACQEVEERLREVMAAQEVQWGSKVASRIAPGRKARLAGAMALPLTAIDAERVVDGKDSSAVLHTVGKPSATALVTDAANTVTTMNPPRRRGRPRKASQEEFR